MNPGLVATGVAEWRTVQFKNEHERAVSVCVKARTEPSDPESTSTCSVGYLRVVYSLFGAPDLLASHQEEKWEKWTLQCWPPCCWCSSGEPTSSQLMVLILKDSSHFLTEDYQRNLWGPTWQNAAQKSGCVLGKTVLIIRQLQEVQNAIFQSSSSAAIQLVVKRLGSAARQPSIAETRCNAEALNEDVNIVVHGTLRSNEKQFM